MLLRSLPRALQADIKRFLWKWTMPKRSPAIIALDRERVKARKANRPVKHIDARAKAITTARLQRQLGVAP